MRTNVVRCPRGRHALAWLEVEDGRAIVVARTVVPGRAKRRVVETRTSAEDLRGTYEEDGEPFSGFTVKASCGCARRFDVDLVSVLEGRAQKLRSDTSDYRDLGVSFDR